MELIKDMEGFIHLVAQAFARARGDEQSHVFADVVVAHARDIAKEDDKTGAITEAVQKDDDALKAAAPAEQPASEQAEAAPAAEAPAETPPAEASQNAQQ